MRPDGIEADITSSTVRNRVAALKELGVLPKEFPSGDEWIITKLKCNEVTRLLSEHGIPEAATQRWIEKQKDLVSKLPDWVVLMQSSKKVVSRLVVPSLIRNVEKEVGNIEELKKEIDEKRKDNEEQTEQKAEDKETEIDERLFTLQDIDDLTLRLSPEELCDLLERSGVSREDAVEIIKKVCEIQDIEFDLKLFEDREDVSEEQEFAE